MTVPASIILNDGRTVPQLGFGVWQIGNDQTPGAVRQAIEAGYRMIDTAAIYGNEEGVGAGLREACVPRSELFVTTKLWNPRQGRAETMTAFDESLARLGLDWIDLFLIHWPAPSRDLFVETWWALIELKKQGRAKSIGVSNFTTAHLQRIMDETGVVPAVNQIELHPRFQQEELRRFHERNGIATESWSPLGRGTLLENPTILDVARKHGRTPAQVILRWHLDLGLIVIPRSSNPARIRENFAVFDFRLDGEDRTRILRVNDENGRIGPNPDVLA